MHWIAPWEKDTDNAALEKRLWDTAVQVTASHVAKAEYNIARPQRLLGLNFRRFADQHASSNQSPLHA
jgi:hypothetical protein